MKKMLQILLLSSLFIVSSLFSTTFEATYSEPVQNGDIIIVKLPPSVKESGVKYIFLLKKNESVQSWQEYELLEGGSPFGNNAARTIQIDGLDVNDAQATLWIVFEDGTILQLGKSFRVIGSEPENDPPIDAGTFTIADSTGGTFDAADTAKATGSGFSASELIFFGSFEERDASDNTITTTVAPTGNLSVDGSGNLSGYSVRNGTAFNSNAVKISLFLFFSSSGSVTSSNRLTITETDPPGLLQAYATALDTIRLVFDEPVSEAGNAHTKFKFSGNDTAGLVIGDLIPIGSQPTANWKLYLSSGMSNRGVGDVKIGYSQSAGGANDSLYDPAGNHMEDTNPDSTVQDSIPADVTTLRDSSNTVALSISNFIGNSTYVLRARVSNGNNDSSLDGVIFEGSDDGSAWTTIGTDGTPTANGSNADFEVTYNVSTLGQFKVFRARAFDDAGAGGANNTPDADDNITESAVVGSSTDGFNDNFEDTYRAVIKTVNPDTIGTSSGVLRSAVVVEIQNNYGTAANTIGSSSTFYISESTTSTETWWDASSGGTSHSDSIALNIPSSVTEDTVWYSNTNAGGPNTLVLHEFGNDFANNNGVVSANGQTIMVIISNVATVSNPNLAADANIDTTITAGDLDLSADVSKEEDSGVGDDFRIIWGMNTSGTGGSYGVTDTSGNLSPPTGGGTITYSVPKANLKNLGAAYDYMFWWVENISSDPNATTLDGAPIKSDPRRLVINPNLVISGGVNGGDVAQGPFTPGQNNQEILSVKFTSDPTAATIQITGLVFDLTGTADGNDISRFNLYLDGGTLGQYDAGVDALLDTVSFPGGNTVSFLNISPVVSVSGSADYVLVTVNVTSGANTGHTLGLNLNNANQIKVADNVINGPKEAITKDPFPSIGTSQDYSLPVKISAFSATAGYGKIKLEWETSSEVNNDGFFIYRSTEQNGEFSPVNTEIIPGQGNSNIAHTYQITDSEVEEGNTYYYKLTSRDFNGTIHEYSSIISATVLEIPENFTLEQNFPNPFNPSTRFRFSMAEAGHVSLTIYNILGQKIRTVLNNELLDVGVYDEFSWDGTDDSGRSVANGIYYYEFQVPDQNIRQVRKMVLLK